MFEVKGVKVAFVGVCTPETFTKSTPTYFQDANGNTSMASARATTALTSTRRCRRPSTRLAAGADYVIGLGHLGIDEQSSP